MTSPQTVTANLAELGAAVDRLIDSAKRAMVTRWALGLNQFTTYRGDEGAQLHLRALRTVESDGPT